VAVVLALFACAHPAAAQLVVNELYYDHPGADAGHEFIEFLNTSPAAVQVSDVVLQFHNGSGSGWSDIWRGTSGVIPPGSLFVVGGASVAPVPDAAVSISLQNGPDAVRILVGGVPADAVGYGGLDDADYAERRSAPAAAPGQSLSRIPDGADSDDNGADLHPSPPSPGGFNVPRLNLGLGTGDATPVRRALDGVREERLTLEARNSGTREVPAGSARLSLRDSSAAGTISIADEALGRVGAGASVAVEVTVRLSPGYHHLLARVHLPGDERAGDDTLVLLRRSGNPGILVSEVHAAPDTGCPQFVELYNASPVARDLSGFALRDHSHAGVTIAGDTLWLGAGECVAITDDRPALLACHPDAPPAAVVELSGTWPTFNRTGSPVADSVVVSDFFALSVDAVGYPAPVAGRSLERVTLFEGSPAVWAVSDAPGGASPGRPGRRVVSDAPARGSVTVAPNPFDPWSGETLRVVVAEAPGVEAVAARVFALSGRPVMQLGTAATLPAVFVWDGNDHSGAPVLPGVFVVTCEFDTAGGGRRVEKVVVGCVGRNQ
jgi:hypothetical protein